MQVITKKVNKLIFAEYNPRQLKKDQYQHLKDSIERFGMVDPIIVNKNKDRKNIIVGGHQRVRVAKKLGIKEVPTVEVDLTYDKERELNVRLNKNVGEFDYDILADLFDLDELIGWGFTEDELVGFSAEDESEGLTDDDAIPEVEEAVTKLGDLWLLGEHRLLCGDSTKKENIDLLMGGQKADMVFTDPPYGCDLGKTILGGEIKNDELHGDDLILFFNSVFENLPLKEWAVIYWFYSSNRVTETRLVAEKHFKLKDTIIWVKDSFVIGRNDYQPQFEPMLYLEKVGNGKVNRVWNGGRNKSNVWNFSRNRNVKHPTNKPIELIVFALKNSSNSNNYIIDPFLGSGSTLIACEKTNRKCYGMELDPHYCDVTVKRWEDFTGKKAVLNGKT